MTTARVAPGPSRPSITTGRVPGRRPPLPTWAPLVWFAALAAVLAIVVVRRPPPSDALADWASAVPATADVIVVLPQPTTPSTLRT